MAEPSLMGSYAEGSKATLEGAQAAEAYQDVKAERGMLQQAMQETPATAKEPGATPTQDLTTTYKLAQQKALAAGSVGLADKFGKLYADAQKDRTQDLIYENTFRLLSVKNKRI